MKPTTQILTTPRMVLEEITPESLAYIMANNTDEEIKNIMGYDDAGLALAKERLEKGMTYYHITFKYWLLKDKTNNNTIGTCGFYRVYPDHDRAEIGYVMTGISYREQGLMKEAAQRILKYGFEEMKMHRIEAFASPTNTPSIKILEGLGMSYEGLMKEHFLKNGLYEDSACYAILKSEYKTS
ncbi:MAG: GNAT family protein [Flavipsychrobacter sp.]